MSVDPRTGPVEGSISGNVSIPSNTIVLLPHLHDHDSSVCLDLLTITDPADENVLAVTYEETPADKLDRWTDNVDVRPNELGVVDVNSGSSAAETAAQRSEERSEVDDSIDVTTVDDPGNLASLGEAISSQIDHWKASQGQTVLCFQSLTALTDQVELEPLFRFLHALLHRLKSAGVVAHFHLDPDTIDEQTINTLLPLFDAVVEHDGDGSIQVRSPGDL